MNLGTEKITDLFKKIFYPTVAGMVFSALFIITDGVFVGKGIGNDALAAVNIVSPIWLLTTGIGLMFGMGGSVMASLYLADNNVGKARVVTTQALTFMTIVLLGLSAISLLFNHQLLNLLGSTERLRPLASDYLWGFAPFLVTNGMLGAIGFYVRLNGATRLAMASMIVSASLNVLFDYLFIFVFKWGAFGAAIATSLGGIIGSGMMIIHLMHKQHTLRFVRLTPRMNHKAAFIRMCGIGFSSLLCELAIATMMICGNYVFASKAGEDGVAAFSIACYFFPIVFMLYTSIAQSAQPLISFNHGTGATNRVEQTVRIALRVAICIGAVLVLLTTIFSNQIAALFVSRPSATHDLAMHGLPVFALGFIPFAINMVAIGYFQSIACNKYAFTITLLRGFIFMVLCFLIVPSFLEIKGAWLAVPFADAITCIFTITLYLTQKKQQRNLQTDVIAV